MSAPFSASIEKNALDLGGLELESEESGVGGTASDRGPTDGTTTTEPTSSAGERPRTVGTGP